MSRGPKAFGGVALAATAERTATARLPAGHQQVLVVERFVDLLDGCGGSRAFPAQRGANEEPPRLLWSTATWQTTGNVTFMQDDGNFVLYDASRNPLWSSGTSDWQNSYPAVQDDGNVVVYNGTTPLKGGAEF